MYRATSKGFTCSGLPLVLAIALMSGCPKPNKTVNVEPKKAKVRIKSFSDASPVRLLAAASPYLFSASAKGLDRWNLDSGEFLQLDSQHGLPGDRVLQMAYDASRSWLWVATDGGMTRYNVEDGTFTPLPKPPSVLGLESFRKVAMSPANDGGLWLAHKRGLFYAKASGQWTATGITEPVSAVMQTRSGWLWFGTGKGLIGRQPDGESFVFGAKKGCDVTEVRVLDEAPSGLPLMIGENADGESRLVLILNDSCASYQVSGGKRILATTRHAGKLLLITKDGFHRMSLPDGAFGNQRNAKIKIKPVNVAGKTAPELPFDLKTMDIRLPPRPLAFAALGDELFVATQFQGTVRADTISGNVRWLRRGDIVEGASMLTVACRERNDCYMGTAGRYAWHYDGKTFRKVDINGGSVQAFLRAPSEDLYALVRPAGEEYIVAYRFDGEKWVLYQGLKIEAEEGLLQLRCARFSPSNLLWVGLEYRDGAGDFRSHGTAVIDLVLGVTVYHRASASDEAAASGIIPIPIGVVDIAFLDADEAWIATTEGAARVRGTDITLYSEADGLESEFLRGISVTSGGIVFAASGRGIAQYDGTNWSLPKALRAPTNDVEMGADGRLWMATDNGVLVFNGARVNRLDKKRGLLQNEIEEIRIDSLGRMWTRGSEGITIITP